MLFPTSIKENRIAVRSQGMEILAFRDRRLLIGAGRRGSDEPIVISDTITKNGGDDNGHS